MATISTERLLSPADPYSDYFVDLGATIATSEVSLASLNIYGILGRKSDGYMGAPFVT